jgi:hypothetical protein
MQDGEPSLAMPPPMTLIQMMTGYWVSQAIYERTAAEHEALFTAAGLELSNVTRMHVGPSILEAVPAK